MVRRDMVDNTVGYRALSMGDPWTRISKLDAPSRKAFVDAATVVLGKNAFARLTRAETAWQAGISVAKNTIVVRSVIVPASNLASNFLQLMTLGVGARDIAKGFSTKLVEINQHLANLDRKVEIRALMARHRGEPVRMRQLEIELQSIEDADKRMSIRPLIEAGEFSTIAEGLTEADASIGQGKWVDWMNNQIDRLPSKLGTVGRYAVISRDTALFKGMSRAVQYGDFLAKAVAYDHLTKREKQAHESSGEPLLPVHGEKVG